ncbi:hypothetical protein AVEN_183911-1 [Araneus ventricosus]|uniref:Uncharacterized protein n=1 Tax=Araneus ventricosus TaxID=182803 RepID=A0A4Y2DZZ6_ARAVE|nr:hypothetical protein AVEN_183911-1 [Araneus ventricosus]
MPLKTPARNRRKEIVVCASASRFTCVIGTHSAACLSETQFQFSSVQQFFAGVGTYASSNISLYTTNGMLLTSFKSVDTNRCVCEEPYLPACRVVTFHEKWLFRALLMGAPKDLSKVVVLHFIGNLSV